jgi:peptide-methionine (R)-S-oxide reductase
LKDFGVYRSMKLLPQILLLQFLLLLACSSTSQEAAQQVQSQPKKSGKGKNPYYSRTETKPLVVSNEEWKKILPPDVYEVAREKGTEYAFSGKLWDFTGIGNYYCVVCGNHLFKSDAKFASSCGWPSFFETIRPNSVRYVEDHSHGMDRIEVQCGRCASHLGHVFDDGPPPTGKRFCMNSIVLDFEPLEGK